MVTRNSTTCIPVHFSSRKTASLMVISSAVRTLNHPRSDRSHFYSSDLRTLNTKNPYSVCNMSFPNGSWDAWYGSPAWPEFSNQENAVEQVSEQPTRLHDSDSYVSSQYTYDYSVPNSGYHNVRHASVPSTSHYLPTWYPTYVVQGETVFVADPHTLQTHAAQQERITPAVTAGADRMSSMPQQVQQSGQFTNHDSPTMNTATPSTPDSPLDTLSDTIMASISSRSHSEPAESDDPDEPTPRRQTPRFAGDEYTARWVRGEGINRAGWCGMCSSWHRLKDSAYWYHMHYSVSPT